MLNKKILAHINMKKLFWVDVIKSVSAVCVVLIHVSANSVYRWGEISLASWQYANILNSLSRMSVLLFLMLSGALLLNKKDTLSKFYSKKAVRILLPWFFWGSIIFIFFNQNKQTIQEIFLGGFWYMPLIAGLYFITPLLRVYLSKAKKYDISFYLICWFIVVSVIPTLFAVLFDKIITYPLIVSYSGVYVGGYLISLKNKLSQRNISYISLIFGINIFVIAFGTYQLTTLDNQLSEVLYAFLSMPVIFSSFCAFVLLKHFFSGLKLKTHSKTKKLISLISQHSLGIFLIHGTILKQLLEYQLFPNNFILTTTLITLMTSLLLLSLLSKIPLLKHFIG